MNALWTEFSDALAGQGLAPQLGVVAATLAEADAAVTAIGTPLCARPLDPTGEYALAIAEHPADAELAFYRARAQSHTGHALFQSFTAYPLYILSAIPGCIGRGDLIHARVTCRGQYAHVPMQYDFIPQPDSPKWNMLADAVLRTADKSSPKTRPAVFLVAETPDGPQPLHAFHIGTKEAVLAHVFEKMTAGTLPNTLCLRFLDSPTGVITRITGEQEAARVPGVLRLQLNAHPGQTVRHITSIAARDALGYLLADTPATAQTAAATIHIETTPVC